MKMRANKNIYWDCWGRLVCVFRKDDVVDVTPIENPDGLLSDTLGTAETPYYPGVRDIVEMTDFTHVASTA